MSVHRAISAQAAHQGRGAADCDEYCEAIAAMLLSAALH
jgi:hypothetical protein